MRRLTRVVAAVLGILVALAGLAAGAMWWWVSHPSVERNPLPPELVEDGSPEGVALEQSALKADLPALRASLQSQEKRSWCGVASSATVLSALRGSPVAQPAVLEAASSVKPPWKVTFGGMVLDDLAGILRANGLRATATHTADASLDAFRQALTRDMADPGDALLVNFDRPALHQLGGGHISPVGAYDPGSDRALVLDVATLRYPPVWVPLDELYAAMSGVDPDSGLTRGWVEARP